MIICQSLVGKRKLVDKPRKNITVTLIKIINLFTHILEVIQLYSDSILHRCNGLFFFLQLHTTKALSTILVSFTIIGQTWLAQLVRSLLSDHGC